MMIIFFLEELTEDLQDFVYIIFVAYKVPIGQEARWVPDPASTLIGRDNVLALTGN
jgi:hypothetical protein